MIDRRATLRLGLLALALSGGAGGLAACSADSSGDDPDLRPAPDADPAGIELVSSDVERAAGDPGLVADVVAGLQSLAGGLYGQVGAGDGNRVLSPYSVLVALGMTLTGAAGRTAQEMRTVLGADGLGDRWHKGVNALTSYVDGLAGPQERADGSKAELALATANQVFGQRGVAWSSDFLDLLAKEYAAAMRGVDFAGATEQARTLINDWVEQQTNDRIVDLLAEGVLTTDTRMVLVNAIHLKAPWEQPFEKGLTVAAPFRLADGSTVQTDLMRSPEARASLATGTGWRAATLPYGGGSVAMTVVLPDEGGLADVERAAVEQGFGIFTADARPAVLDLHLPKWTFRTEAGLVEPLRALGMKAAFGAADFTPMTDEDLDLYVSDVRHQGFIAVDEEGTEAAAATAVVVSIESAVLTDEFKVDRPFLFLIHDTEHGTPLFVGRVTDPTAQ